MYWVNARDGVIIEFWKYISNIYFKKKTVKMGCNTTKEFFDANKNYRRIDIWTDKCWHLSSQHITPDYLSLFS